MTKLTFLAAGALALFCFTLAQAQDFRQGDLTISGAWARPTAEGQKNGAAYFSVKNGGGEADKLLSVESPAAEKTELHQTVDEGGVMKMLPVTGGVAVQPGSTLEFKPGSYHVMLLGLKNQLKEGQSIPLSLTFAKAGAVTVEAKVEKSPSSMDDMHHMH